MDTCVLMYPVSRLREEKKTNVFNFKWRDQISNAAHLHSRINKTTANYYITAVKCAWQKKSHIRQKKHTLKLRAKEYQTKQTNETQEKERKKEKKPCKVSVKITKCVICMYRHGKMFYANWANFKCDKGLNSTIFVYWL